MELRQLRYFVALAEELHFARAAGKLGISQPSLSVQIQALEASLSTKLLSRTPRAVQLTTAGAVFLEEARLTLAQADRALGVGRRAGRGELGSIRIGLAVAGALSGLPARVMAQFRRRHPEVDLQLSVMNTNRQLEALRVKELDVGFLVRPSHVPAELDAVTLGAEQLVVAMSADHPLAARETVDASDLADEPFLVVHPDVSTGIYECTFLVGRHGGFAPRIVRIERDLITLVSLAGVGFGLVIVSESATRLAVPSVAYRPLPAVPSPYEIVAVFRRHETALPTRTFVDAVLAWPSRPANPTGGTNP